MLLLLLTSAHAQSPASDWPSRPVTLVVPSSPGGGTDVYGRILAQALTEHLKQSFVVENKPGASGAIGATLVAKAEGDGYTLLVASNSSLGINPVLLKSPGYDVQRDFAPVTRGVIAPMVVVAHPDAKVKTLADLLERGRREPGKLFYGTAGVGSPLYIGMRMIEVAAGAQFGHVPYKGAGAAYTDLLAGRLQFMLTDLVSVRQHIDSGKLLELAVTDKTRLLPNTPTAGRGRSTRHHRLHLVLGVAAGQGLSGAGAEGRRRGRPGDARSRHRRAAGAASTGAGVRHARAIRRVIAPGAAELGRFHSGAGDHG